MQNVDKIGIFKAEIGIFKAKMKLVCKVRKVVALFGPNERF